MRTGTPCGAARSRQFVSQVHRQGEAKKARPRLGANQGEASYLRAMELWVAFAFGALVGTFVGVFVGRHRAAATRRAAPPVTPAPPPRTPLPAEVKHVVLDEGSANVLNALNNRLAAIGPLADLLHGSPH